MQQQPLLEVKNLKTRFKITGAYVNAVNGISYALNEGDSLGVVGESGCGKSVGVMSVMRLIPQPPGEIYDGEVLYGGRDLLKLSPEEMRHVRGKEIAMIFQDPMTSLNPVMRIGRQITEALELHMVMDKKQARARAAELLTMVGIPRAADRLDDYPHQFSGGMRQRVMIAIALSCMPQVLIADEPTTALDVTIQAQIVDLVKKLRDELGMAVIWITHDLGVVARLVKNVVVMYAGFIIERSPVEDLYAHPSHPYTLGLLGSLPRLDTHERERLVSIQGAPPDLVDMPKGCPFRPRCRFAIDRCSEENPPLMPISLTHESACWVDVTTGRPR
ncbi:MAG TPA: ABC transporter ATP-binding protein [Anaerolineae bacterium]|nr:ABC transporter ATP-binding protein [Anaerolineae bacterium]